MAMRLARGFSGRDMSCALKTTIMAGSIMYLVAGQVEIHQRLPMVQSLVRELQSMRIPMSLCVRGTTPKHWKTSFKNPVMKSRLF